MSDVDALRGVELFDGLTDAQLGSLHKVAREHSVPAGTVIVHEGGLGGDVLFVLTGGSVGVTKRLGLTAESPDDGARQKTIVRLEAPQAFGEMCLIEDAERSATITAHSDCKLLEIGRADFERLVEADLVLGYCVVRNIARVLSFRLRRTDRDVLKLTAALSLALGNR